MKESQRFVFVSNPQACQSTFSTVGTGQLRSVTKDCVETCAQPGRLRSLTSNVRRYCCYGNYCNQELNYSKCDRCKRQVAARLSSAASA